MTNNFFLFQEFENLHFSYHKVSQFNHKCFDINCSHIFPIICLLDTNHSSIKKTQLKIYFPIEYQELNYLKV